MNRKNRSFGAPETTHLSRYKHSFALAKADMRRMQRYLARGKCHEALDAFSDAVWNLGKAQAEADASGAQTYAMKQEFYRVSAAVFDGSSIRIPKCFRGKGG